MVLMIFLLFTTIGTLGMIYQLRRQHRRQRLIRLMNGGEARKQATAQADKTAALEKVMQKTNRVVSLSAMLDKNIIVKTVTVLILMAVVMGLNAFKVVSLSRDWLLIILLVIVMLVILLPNMIKRTIISRRADNISQDLPFIIDMMAICIQSGMTIEKALSYLAANTSTINPDIAVLLDRTMMRSEVSGITTALEQLYEEVPGNEMRMFCTTLQQSIRYGSSIYQVLMELSKDIREMQLLATDEKVASLAAKMTMPMIGFIMFPLIVIIAGPNILRMLTLWSN